MSRFQSIFYLTKSNPNDARRAQYYLSDAVFFTEYPDSQYLESVKYSSSTTAFLLCIFQILTAEDEESPIMSFSSGTIIGEISTIIATPSRANIRCATYCEVQTLSLDGLARVLLSFPEKQAVTKRYLQQKIDQAKEILTNVAETDPGGAFLEEHEHDTIRWIKNRWRQLYQLQVRYITIMWKMQGLQTSGY